MGLETATYISGLNANNPINATDVVGEGDDHLRLIKSTILNTFPNVTGAVTKTHTELNNALVTTEQNELTSVVSSADYPLKVNSATPGLSLYESDGGADAKAWDFIASGETLLLRARTDDYSTGANILKVERTAAVIDAISFGSGDAVQVDFSNTRLAINDGYQLRLWDAANTDYVNMRHNGTSLVYEYGGTTAVQHYGGIRHDWLDSTNADRFSLQNDGTRLVVTASNLSSIALQNNFGLEFTGNAAGNDGTRFIRATGDALLLDYDSNVFIVTALGDDQTRFRDSAETNRLVIDYSIPAVMVQNGAMFRVYGPSNNDYLEIRESGAASIIEASTNDLFFRTAGNDFIFGEFDDVSTDLILRTNTDFDSRLTFTHGDGVTGMAIRLDSSGALSGGDVHGELVFETAGSARYCTIYGDTGEIETPNSYAAEFGWKGVVRNTQNANYTLQLSDAGKFIYKASGGAGETITIPANSSVSFPIGTIIEIINRGGGNLSIAITSDTLYRLGDGATGTRTLGDDGKAVIEKVDSTVWAISGVGLS